MATISTKTIRLLNQEEVDEIYGLPKLTNRKRDTIFSLNSQEQEIFSSLRTIPSKVLFILQLGLFRVKKRFYTIQELDKEEESKKYLLQRYFPEYSGGIQLLNTAKPTRFFHQNHILNLFGYKRYIGDVVFQVKKKAVRLARIHALPNYVMRELVRFLNREKIITPAYSTLHNLVGMAVQKETKRLNKALDSILSDNQKELLDELVTKRENFLHELTCLKRTPKNFALNEVLSTIAKRDKLVKLHSDIDRCIENLEISEHNLFYYAQLVVYYTIYKVSRIPVLKRRLLLFCFVHVRYRMINDYLIKAFLYRVDNYVREAKKKVADERKEDRVYHKKNNKLGKMLLLLVNRMYLPNNISMEKGRESLFSILNESEVEELALSQ